MPTETIPLAEIFGPTIQGEGALAGRPTYFVRIGGCDFKCLWCDTAHAVNPEEVRKLERATTFEMSVDLIEHAKQHPGPEWLTISGGNPAMYDLGELVTRWQGSHARTYGIPYRKVAVETQGSRFQEWLTGVDLLTVSPKPPSSGMTQKYGADEGLIGLPLLQSFISRFEDSMSLTELVLKCIVFDDTDYEFARAIHIRYPSYKFFLSCGTAMGGLSGRWVPPPIPDLAEDEPDLFKGPRANPDIQWAPRTYVDRQWYLLRRYRWLVEKMASDPAMADVAAFPQMHALVWGITTKGV